MSEDEREELIYGLLDEFRASVGAITDDQKYAFIAGARSALVTIEEADRAIATANTALGQL
jgi:hypothetical protein